MTRTRAIDRLRTYFTAPPVCRAVFQVGPGRLTGIRAAVKNGSPAARSSATLRPGAVVPSMDRPNVADAAHVEAVVAEAVRALGLTDQTAALLLPELCARVYIVSVDSVAASPDEREAIFRWRVAKQAPSLPEDARWSVDYLPAGVGERIVGAVARSGVVAEYEALFAKNRVRIGAATLPTLSLLRLLQGAPGGNAVLVNAEEGALAVAAVMEGKLALYRQKPLAGDDVTAAHVVKEAENTIHFLEDREREKVETVWVRSVLAGGDAAVEEGLAAALRIPVRSVASVMPAGIEGADRTLLAPLLGQVRK
jgi:hypothetical protein